MHEFPSEEKDPNRRRNWVRFVNTGKILRPHLNHTFVLLTLKLRRFQPT